MPELPRQQPNATSRLSTLPSQKARQLSHLHSQLAQLTAHVSDLENLLRMTAVQAESMRGLGGYAGGMYAVPTSLSTKQRLPINIAPGSWPRRKSLAKRRCKAGHRPLRLTMKRDAMENPNRIFYSASCTETLTLSPATNRTPYALPHLRLTLIMSYSASSSSSSGSSALAFIT
jgi:DASH complex subunit Hsk3 like